MVEYRLIIPGRLPCLNDLIKADRAHYRKGAELKKDSQKIVEIAIRDQFKFLTIEKPVYFDFYFFEESKRRDKDNISAFARKVVQDALVSCGVLRNDGWKEIIGYIDHFDIDKDNPRIEVVIKEVE